ncbi:hypothetical protein KY311_05190 [Candidatus Woesearchaeota archaeon]|nr:hypothetical protein [Candidatus Woesearchaeota archaeon]
MAEEVTITFETLYDILRREKNLDELQELNPDFFMQVVDYLNEKNAILENSSEQESLFGHEDKRQTRLQLDNIKRILRELYELREKKIISLARDVSRTGANLVNEKAFLEEEKLLYQSALELLNRFRKGVLANVLIRKMPEIEEQEPKTLKRETENQSNDNKLVRFIEPVQEFVGPDLVSFGPFKKDDVASLPSKVAKVLLNKGSAEQINGEE